MYPRYVPRVAPGAWLRWLGSTRSGARAAAGSVRSALAGGADLPHARAYDNLRTGLAAWFLQLARARGAGRVLVSAQICAAVPRALAAAGCVPRYVDIDERYPTPGAKALAAALDADTIAVIVAPLYGHIQEDWDKLLAALAGRALVLDLAQGVGLASRLSRLCRAADAVTYSFGLGKGLDTGGGLVLARQPLESHPASTGGASAALRSLGGAAALRAVVASGLYPLVARRADEFDAGRGAPSPSAGYEPERLATLWRDGLAGFSAEIALARARAAALAESAPLAARLRDNAIYLGSAASHLRQVVRVADPRRRDALVTGLREEGIDCAPAGEPLPEGASAADFPNAARFRDDAIRLPFLGRMSGERFRGFRTILERAVARHLS